MLAAQLRSAFKDKTLNKKKLLSFTNSSEPLSGSSNDSAGAKLVDCTEYFTYLDQSLIDHGLVYKTPSTTMDRLSDALRSNIATLKISNKKIHDSTEVQVKRNRSLSLASDPSDLVKRWERDIVPNWPKSRRTARNLIWLDGIPHHLRRLIWKMAIGDRLNISVELYKVFLERARQLDSESKKHIDKQHTESDRITETDAEEAPQEQQQQGTPQTHFGQENSLTLIPLDLLRSSVTDERHLENINNVLMAYVCFRPDIGYVQGMSYLALMLSETEMNDYEVFACLSNLLNGECLQSFYSMNMQKITPYIRLHETLLKEYLPEISDYFQTIGLTTDMYLYDWILTVFVRALPKSICLRVWDGFLLRGDKHLFIIALGVLKCLKPLILSSSFEDIALMLTRGSSSLKEVVTEDALIESMRTIQFSTKYYSALLVSCQVHCAANKERNSDIRFVS